MPRIPTGRARVAVIAAASVAAIGGGAAVTLGVASGTGTSAPSAQTPAERPGPRGGGAALDAVATYLGLSADALRDELRSGTTLAALAAERGKTVDGLVDAIVAAETRRLQEAVAAGRLTDAERDRIVADLPERVRGLVERSGPPRGGPGMGRHGGGAAFQAAAAYIGITREQLRTRLRDGRTLAQVATAEGKTVNGLVDAIVAAETRRLQEAVAAGRLTDAERDRIVAGLPQRVRRMVTSTRPGPGGPGGRDCPPGERPGAAASAAGLRYGTGAATS